MDKNTYQKFKTSGVEFLKSGQFADAIEAFKKYSDCNTDDSEALMLLGDAYLKKGEKITAVDCYSRALIVDPVHTANLLKLSALQLEGPNYLEVLKYNHERVKPKRYVEIGVCKGASFTLSNSESISIGIDPEPQLDRESLPETHKVINDTSDNYFRSGNIVDDLNDKPFDMAFLDGMHLFEYALRDFMNLEKSSSPESVVFVHDLYPMNAETATRERNSNFWSGDVWKLVLCLQEYRPDLKLEILPCPPTGLGVVTKLDANSTILHDKYDEIIEKYLNMPFSVIEENRPLKLLLTDVDSPWLP